jgi:hypothetical protein
MDTQPAQSLDQKLGFLAGLRLCLHSPGLQSAYEPVNGSKDGEIYKGANHQGNQRDSSYDKAPAQNTIAFMVEAAQNKDKHAQPHYQGRRQQSADCFHVTSR